MHPEFNGIICGRQWESVEVSDLGEHVQILQLIPVAGTRNFLSVSSPQKNLCCLLLLAISRILRELPCEMMHLERQISIVRY